MAAAFLRSLLRQPWPFELPRRLTVGSQTRRKKKSKTFQPNEQLLSHTASVNIIDPQRFASGSKNWSFKLRDVTTTVMIDVE